MEIPSKQWLTAIIFEHACKHDLENVLLNLMGDQELAPKLLLYCSKTEARPSGKPRIKPVFFLTYLLRKLRWTMENFVKSLELKKTPWDPNVLPVIFELMEVTYLQNNFLSLKKYFSLITELKLLDLMILLKFSGTSTQIIQKLNLLFPRWRPSDGSKLKQEFNIGNPKIIETVEETQVQCRRLILKITVDKGYRCKYMSEQYSSDLEKILVGAKTSLQEAIDYLDAHAGLSVIEKIHDGDDSLGLSESDDLEYQLLLDYLQPKISAESLLRFLQDFEPMLFTQPIGGLASCLLPLETMSEASDLAIDSNSEHDSEPENSGSDEDLMSFECITHQDA